MKQSNAAQTDINFPAIGYPVDGDPVGLPDMISLVGIVAGLEPGDRHLGMEVADAAGRGWIVTGLHRPEPVKRLWPFKRVELREEVELDEREPLTFDAARARIADYARARFDDVDDLLRDVETAADMAALCQACVFLEVQLRTLRILSGDPAVPIRAADDVARRAVLLFAIMRFAAGVSRKEIIPWLGDHGLTEAVSPLEAALLTASRPDKDLLSQATWEAEGLVALLWALGLTEMPPADSYCDGDAIAEMIPPAANVGVEAFVRGARLRAPQELARMWQEMWRQRGAASDSYDRTQTPEAFDRYRVADRRWTAMQWIVEPEAMWE